MRKVSTVAIAALFLFSDPALAGEADADLIGRLTLLQPKAGMNHSFEEGYQRHLEWHRRNGDPWTWHGWSVVMGDRYGVFVDASLGHAPQDLSSPVKPAEDAA